MAEGVTPVIPKSIRDGRHMTDRYACQVRLNENIRHDAVLPATVSLSDGHFTGDSLAF